MMHTHIVAWACLAVTPMLTEATAVVARRALLAGVCGGLSCCPGWREVRPPSVLAMVEPEAVRGGTALSSWGQPWSNTCAWSSNPPPLKAAAASLPCWLEGSWHVQSSIQDVTFPLGRKFISDTVPGVRMASILMLPNVGNTPNFDVSFIRGRDGAVYGDQSARAQALLEAFWPQARVVSAEQTAQIGRTLLWYEAPSRRGGRKQQSVDLRMCSSEGQLLSQGRRYFAQQVFQQDNVEQGVRGYYMVLDSFERDGEHKVRWTQRIAAFLQPTDSLYMDALGKPVALYDYVYTMSPLDRQASKSCGTKDTMS
mmetsp:Transcript_51834/g.119164  ORF Transcript_51834/g.119164 Transcript_51834/m.119164 type:complete len:311 (-) Transcript_51834:26-958(-)